MDARVRTAARCRQQALARQGCRASSRRRMRRTRPGVMAIEGTSGYPPRPPRLQPPGRSPRSDNRISVALPTDPPEAARQCNGRRGLSDRGLGAGARRVDNAPVQMTPASPPPPSRDGESQVSEVLIPKPSTENEVSGGSSVRCIMRLDRAGGGEAGSRDDDTRAAGGSLFSAPIGSTVPLCVPDSDVEVAAGADGVAAEVACVPEYRLACGVGESERRHSAVVRELCRN